MEVQRLIREGMSDRKISKKLKISRMTIGRIRKGVLSTARLAERKQLSQVRHEQKELDKAKEAALPLPINPDSADYDSRRVVEYVRCPTCGAKVQAQVHCLACKQKRELADGYDCYMRELLMVTTNVWPAPTGRGTVSPQKPSVGNLGALRSSPGKSSTGNGNVQVFNGGIKESPGEKKRVEIKCGNPELSARELAEGKVISIDETRKQLGRGQSPVDLWSAEKCPECGAKEISEVLHKLDLAAQEWECFSWYDRDGFHFGHKCRGGA
jgi:predicted RNA-binding Zn-ribbon protein involved in translation (DUF1610 family)